MAQIEPSTIPAAAGPRDARPFWTRFVLTFVAANFLASVAREFLPDAREAWGLPVLLSFKIGMNLTAALVGYAVRSRLATARAEHRLAYLLGLTPLLTLALLATAARLAGR